jgi:hypothetical protein
MQQQPNQNGNGHKPGPANSSSGSIHGGKKADMVENPFGSQQMAPVGGGSAQALAQREIAEVQAAMVIAKRFPRDPVVSMDRILNACTRPMLAEKAAYEYAKGGQDVSGPSIRLAEVLAQNWGNMRCGVIEVSRGVGVSECLAYATDIETNFGDEKRVQVRHWRDTKSGGYAIKDEREIYELIANMGARRKRACILAVIPGDVQEAAVRQCEVTLATKIKVTDELILSLVEKFSAFNVTKEMIEKRIQRRMDVLTPGLVVNLGKIYNSLKDGMSIASEWFDMQATGETAETVKATPTSKMDAMASGGAADMASAAAKHAQGMAAEAAGQPAGEAAKTPAAEGQQQQQATVETTVKTTKPTGKGTGKKAADKPAPAPAPEPEEDSLFGEKT